MPNDHGYVRNLWIDAFACRCPLTLRLWPFHYTWLHAGANDTWFVIPLGSEDVLFRLYHRPVYTYQNDDKDQVILAFTGSRWLSIVFEGGTSRSLDYWANYAANFHPFWFGAFSNNTNLVSEATSGSTPVGVDFYRIVEQGNQYGPLGHLIPRHTYPGEGFYRCIESNTEQSN